MTHILLISDTEKVKQVFESLAADGSLQLRTAVTLDQADLEIAASAPEFTFVQSRISGFSSAIILRHLKKMLPSGAKIVLLAGDAEAWEQAQQLAEFYLDLALSDEALAGGVNDVLNGVWRPTEAVAAGEVLPTQDDQPPVEEDAGNAPPVEPITARAKASAKVRAEAPAKAKAKEPAKAKAEGPAKAKAKGPATAKAKGPATAKAKGPATAEAKGPATAEAKGPAADEAKEPATVRPEDPVQARPEEPVQARAKEPVQAEMPAGLLPQGSGAAGAASFAEVMRRASIKGEPSPPDAFEAEERDNPANAPSDSGQPGLSYRLDHTANGTPISVRDFRYGEPLADAMRRARKKRRSAWMFALPLLLIGIPIICYLLGQQDAPLEPPTPRSAARPARLPKRVPAAGTATAALPAPEAGSKSSGTPVATSVPGPVAQSAAKPAAQSGAQPVAPPAAARSAAQPAVKPVVKAGLKSLPPVVTHAKLDADYGKTHPGWQRYLETGVEYKLFKDAGLFQALQVLARNGGSLPDQLFKRALLEFGGTGSYQTESKGVKGKYLVEQGEAKNGVALTLYRSKGDHQMKAFVLYYH